MNEKVVVEALAVVKSHSDDTLKAYGDILAVRSEYQRLVDEKRLTKPAMCSLVVPFRDAYGLTDLQALTLAREPISIDQMDALIK